MMRLAIVAAALALLGVTMPSTSAGTAAGTAVTAAANPSATPGIYDPGNTGTVASAWVKHLGLTDPRDAGDVDRFGLLLSKNATSVTTNSAAFAVIKNVAGKHITELGFDIRNGGHCGAGSPRFNLVTNDNILHFVGGCSNGTRTPDIPPDGFSRVRFDLVTFGNPAVTSTETIKSLSVLSDEGFDTGPDFSGLSVIDNIDINGFLIGAPAGSS
jgi:hypothetical protein